MKAPSAPVRSHQGERLVGLRVLCVRARNEGPYPLQAILEQSGVAVELASGEETARLDVCRPDLNVVVLDLVPRKPVLLQLLGRWRQTGVAIPVLAVAQKRDLVRCLDAGADDCVEEWVSPEELLARLRALARRYAASGPTFQVGDLVIDTRTREVQRGGRTIPLTPREFDLLKLLVCYRGRVVSRTLIFDQLFGEATGTSNVVDVYIRYLRNKIDRGFSPPLILTSRGAGYMLRGDGSTPGLPRATTTLAPLGSPE